ncbi:MAG: type III secretion system export apparatus subunit SctV [Burkholderiales bacterium]|nr:type III secretion system export apparatus subunit SctV [Burkholderiales bacterium]
MKKQLNIFLSANKELSIIVIVICVMMMMILPLPPHVLDFIISFNIFITITLLMSVIYMRFPLELTSFPSLLLILALIRVGITISSSRLILMEGDAGDIVHTFGEFVVGGNLVIGIMIFTTITMINFIVITKGSERVAEVAARFSLDAMPGKQMSIDADVRAGSLTQEKAESMRKDLASESQLYGAMDGAMKFVKGDSIASIIDIVINICGGLIIGILQLGMTLGDAFHTYTILTVGDGMVQQIPQLLISLTAGLMITKVAGKEQQNIGQMVLTQVFSNTKALIGVAVLLIGFSAIPGMPTMIFVGISGSIFIIVYFMNKKKATNKNVSDGLSNDDVVVEDKEISSNGKGENFVSWKLSPLMLHMAANLKNTDYVDKIKNTLINIQNDIMLDLGITVPQIIIQFQAIADDSYKLLVSEIPVTEAKVYKDYILVLYDDVDILDALDLEDSVENEIQFGVFTFNSKWVKAKNANDCDEFEIKYFTFDEFLHGHLKFHILNNISIFIGIQEVKDMIINMKDYDELIKELLKMLPLNRITEILQRLIAENISIRNFKAILDALLEWSQKEKDIVMLTELVRKSLGRNIAYKFSHETFVINAIILAEDFEDTIRNNIEYNSFGGFIQLDEATHNEIIYRIHDIMATIKRDVSVYLVTHIDIRRYVRMITEKYYPTLHVLSTEEIHEFAEIKCIGVLDIAS